MFLLPWGTGTRNEKAAPEKVKPPAVMPLQSPMDYLPPINKMKRKRGGSDELGSQLPGITSGELPTGKRNHIDFPQPACSGSEASAHTSHNTTFASATSPPLTPVDKADGMAWEQTQKSLGLDDVSTSTGKLDFRPGRYSHD